VPKIIAREGESFQVTLRKFKKSCEKAGLLSDIKKNNYYEKPTKPLNIHFKAKINKNIPKIISKLCTLPP